MSIGADWRQISPGAGAQTANGAQQSAAKAGNPAQQAAENGESGGFASFLFGDDGFDFGDIIDVINPLQHIPVVGALYRELTGDQMGNAARVVGGGLFGGIFGLAGAAVDAAVEGFTGEDTGAHVLALFEGDDSNSNPATAIAQNDNANSNPDASATASTPGNGLVLPWSTGDTSLASAMAGEQAAAQNAVAATLPFDQANPASETVAENIAQSAPMGTNAAAALAPTPASFNRSVPNSAAQPAQQDAPAAENPFERGALSAAKSADPAELAVTLARAGHSDYASRMVAQRETTGASSRLSANVHVNHEKGATVWQRAENNGRVSGPSFGGDVQGELIKARAQQGRAETERMNPALMTDAALRDDMASGPVLSPAEMAARFNSALGLGPVSNSASSNNDRPANGANNRASASGVNRSSSLGAGNDQLAANTSAGANNANADVSDEHPLLREAEQHNAGQAPVGAWFSQTMMDGLQKYQAMQKRQQNQGSI
ncbi:hypothetical protein [Thalassospira marina]|uniref:Uncharacterized protein n=1 Tax=Thalassospira marina TaxID=2048283 RepID=A0ABM6QDR9_9PROT|nr:hypothetical protein [Thalassospira marina]AUG54643.1 hypothetical protein CSC3H3_19410 [Thalassospira marina]